MLTVADRNQAEIPEELSGDRSWFQWFVSASRLLGGPAKSKPAIAYMLATDRWYTGIRKRYGDEAAQELEKDVWIDQS